MKIFSVFLFIVFLLAVSWVSPPVMRPKLSDYGEFGSASPYSVPTPLFSDYAEKERRVFVPAGKRIVFDSRGVGDFPEGSVLFKTFYYWRDARDTVAGRVKMETRVLMKTAVGWEAGAYVWDSAQRDAYLRVDGERRRVDWIDKDGVEHGQKYFVPDVRQCGSCHAGDRGSPLRPIGYTARNLPDWRDHSVALEKRARAYLDMNCAHCHNPSGMCRKSDLRLGYELSLEETGIVRFRKQIIRFMKNGRMPLLGTHVVHREGVSLVEEYIATISPL